MNFKEHIAEVPDFPNPGILFYDISPLLADSVAWKACIMRLADIVTLHKPEFLIGIESRGFLVAAPLAIEIGCGLILARKINKLPGPTTKHDYDLEYGTDTLEMQSEAIQPNQRVVIIDDLLATGGTMAATVSLAQKFGADVRATCCIIELAFLEGHKKVTVPFSALISYEK